MFSLTLDYLQTAALGAVMLAVGLFILSRSTLLKRFCIPATVVGGLLFAIVNLGLHEAEIADISLDAVLKDFFMVVFFCSIGFLASFRMLRSGGRMVIILLIGMAVIIMGQNIIGPIMASAFGMDPLMGLCMGSIPLVGGHGTAVAYAEIFEQEFGLKGAEVVAIAAATFGLAFSSLIGGPLANRLVRKNNLYPSREDRELAAEAKEIVDVDDNHFMKAFIMILVCVGLGTLVNDAIRLVDVSVPTYLGSMLVALVVRNYFDYKGYHMPIREISAIGTMCLSMFLVMALMVLQLWELFDMAGPMMVILLAQTLFVMLFSYFVIFRITGKSYDSAAYVTATCGFSLGATPNAMANMKALFHMFGEAPTAYFIVPLVGSVFVDLLNTGLITLFIGIL